MREVARREASPVAYLGCESESAEVGHSSIGREAGRARGERAFVDVELEIRLDGVEMGVESHEDGSVVVIGPSKGGVVEATTAQPLLVGQRPRRAGSIDLTVAEQELGEPMARPGAIDDDVGAGPGQVSDRLFGFARDVHRRELARPIEVHEATGVALVGLDLGPRGDRDQRGGDDLGGHAEALKQASQVIAGRPRLVADTHVAGVAHGLDEAPHARLIVEPAVDDGRLRLGSENG